MPITIANHNSGRVPLPALTSPPGSGFALSWLPLASQSLPLLQHPYSAPAAGVSANLHLVSLFLFFAFVFVCFHEEMAVFITLFCFLSVLQVFSSPVELSSHLSMSLLSAGLSVTWAFGSAACGSQMGPLRVAWLPLLTERRLPPPLHWFCFVFLLFYLCFSKQGYWVFFRRAYF